MTWASTPTHLTSSSTIANSYPNLHVITASNGRSLTVSVPSPSIGPPTNPGVTVQAFDDPNLRNQCLSQQILPRVSPQLNELERRGISTTSIIKQLVQVLNDDEFRQDFNRRGDGTISAELADRIAQRARVLVDGTLRRLEAPIPTPAPPQPPLVPAGQQHLQHQFQQQYAAPIPYYCDYNGSPQGLSAPVAMPPPPPPLQLAVQPPPPPPPGPTTVPMFICPPPPKVTPAPAPVKPSTAPIAPRPQASKSNGNPPTKARPPPEVFTISSDDDDEPAPAKRPKTEPPRPEHLKLESPKTKLHKSEPIINLNRRKPIPPRPEPLKASELVDLEEERTSKSRQRPLALLLPSKPTTSAAPLPPKPTSKWFSKKHPYLSAGDREAVVAGTRVPSPSDTFNPSQFSDGPRLFHVDFTDDEVSALNEFVRQTYRKSSKPVKEPRKDLAKFIKKNPALVPAIVDDVRRQKLLPRRSRLDVTNFLTDLINGKVTKSAPAVLTLGLDEEDKRGDLIRSSRVHSLLFAREICGHRGVGSMRTLVRFNNEFRKCREDGMEKRAEWTGCAGDVSTIVWVSNDGFICGTTEHSDAHNQQYNKPGNLVLGSCSGMSLRAYPEHRIVRPVVDKGENSTEAMRQSQDPWLYASVVSSDYDAAHDRAFTSSFDHTVKIWKVEKSGASMELLGEWKHGGNVNFVSVSTHESGMVATASDVAVDAVRIYSVDEADISNSPFRSFSCSRVTDEMGNTVSTEKWAYYPATMQWGRADKVKHLLLVGYSPRSRTGDDNDIPLDRRDSGELCLWDGLTGERWKVLTATKENVFEVLWHPTQEVFIAATSPSGNDLVDPGVKTQIRIFTPADKDKYGAKAFNAIMALDCPAVDVNELTIMPSSMRTCYVTAGCTDGKVYVWDTAQGDKPVHVLAHGEPIDEYRGDREREDVGVKFTAWGTSLDRFYTASSDGVVKVWNVRCQKNPLVRNLLEAPAPITAGMFSPDKSRLVVGDASGRVFLLSIDEEKPQAVTEMKIPVPGGGFKTIRVPPRITLHPDPPPPTHDANGNPLVPETGPARGRAYLASGQLERHPDPTIGVVQGPNYAQTGLFRREWHFACDPRFPLLAEYEAMQQEVCKPPSVRAAAALGVGYGSHSGGMGRRRRARDLLALRSVLADEVAAAPLTAGCGGVGEVHRRNLEEERSLEEELEMAAGGLEEVDWALMGEFVFVEE
ncbi:hypothetical protein VTJ04DRAFT_9213 [Mycothermus thermophilus]|uniref:uncharacterized protein n=1 Tax=Humicola insolens TaxID=85995 RepID=UPI00374290D3